MFFHRELWFSIVGLCLVGLYYAKADIFDLPISGYDIDYIDPHAFDYEPEERPHTATAKLPKHLHSSRASTQSSENVSKKLPFYEKTPDTCRNELQRCLISLRHRPNINDVADESLSRKLVNMLLTRAMFKVPDGQKITTISLFKETKDDEEIGLLKFQATPAELTKLKEFGQGRLSLREVDPILDEVLIESSEDRMMQTARFLHHMLVLSRFYHDNLIKQIRIFAEERHYDIDQIAMIVMFYVLGLAMIRRLKEIRYPRICFISFMILAILTISYFVTYRRILLAEESKLTALQMQFMNMPASCRPDEMWFWQKWLYYEPRDCEKYFEARTKNHLLEVTPAEVFARMLTDIVYEPVIISGKMLNGFTRHATEGLPFPLTWIMTVIYAIIFVVLVWAVLAASLCSAVVLLGGSLSFGWGFFSLKGPESRLDSIRAIENNSNENVKAEQHIEAGTEWRRIRCSEVESTSSG